MKDCPLPNVIVFDLGMVATGICGCFLTAPIEAESKLCRTCVLEEKRQGKTLGYNSVIALFFLPFFHIIVNRPFSLTRKYSHFTCPAKFEKGKDWTAQPFC